jgi:Protein of unknown function (DUF4238)
MSDFKKKNHYVPRMYLRQWSIDGNRVHMYRLLVSSNSVPSWKEASIKGIARHEHLYTRVMGGDQSDEFERWIDAEFESPAVGSFRAIVEGRKLSKDEWWNLIRFLAAQDVRTPARLMHSFKRWEREVPKIIEEVSENAVKMLGQRNIFRKKGSVPPYVDLLPIRVSINPSTDGESGDLRVETDIGRGYWLFQMRHLLTRTAEILHRYRWSLMVPPDGVEWITSDDPVIKLNYHSELNFDFEGGWNSPGTEILMPLSPKRILYTKVGDKRLPREINVDEGLARSLNKIIANHAHRAIFSAVPNDDVVKFRPRRVDADLESLERRQWSRWAADADGAATDM